MTKSDRSSFPPTAALRDHVRAVARFLEEAGVESAALCAQVLAAHVTHLGEIEFILSQDRSLEPETVSRLHFFAGRLAGGAPLSQVTGRREFYGRDFAVDENVLVPRPDTELLVDLALKFFPKQAGVIFADFGAGSGCIGITLALERPGWRGIMLEKSLAALGVAARNRHSLQAGMELAGGDMFAPPLQDCCLDLVVANPPYIGPRDEVMDCVRDFEPPCALFSDGAGLAHLAACAREGARVLRPGGMIFLEHGAAQGPAVADFLRKAKFSDIEIHHDLAGRNRVCGGRKI